MAPALPRERKWQLRYVAILWAGLSNAARGEPSGDAQEGFAKIVEAKLLSVPFQRGEPRSNNRMCHFLSPILKAPPALHPGKQALRENWGAIWI